MKKILVTGSSGFIGSHVADMLEKEGHEVILFDATPSKYKSENQKEFIGDIIVEKDKIIDVDPNVYKKDKPKSYTNVHDCKNLFISPGLLDMRVSLI